MRGLGHTFQDLRAPLLTPKILDELVVRHSIEPRRGIVGNSLLPCSQRGDHRVLNRVLDQLDVSDADAANECRHQPAVVVPKGILDEARRLQGYAISRISRLAPGM
jgi:hypothetical protein